jgi:hypothetical protein
MAASRSAATARGRRRPECSPGASRRRARPAVSRTADLPLAVWPCAQRTRPQPSLWQLLNLRHALARGERTHLVCHEDVPVFQKPQSSLSSRKLNPSDTGHAGGSHHPNER